MGRYHAILFDMDGTLLDTLTDMQDAVNHVLAAHGLPLRTLEEVRRFVGNGAGPLIHRALPEGYPQEQKVLAEYRAYYQAHNCVQTCPYPGIPELLEQLRQRGLKLAVVSNKPDETTRTLAARFFPGLAALGQRDGIPSKPAPEMVWSAMEQLGVGCPARPVCGRQRGRRGDGSPGRTSAGGSGLGLPGAGAAGAGRRRCIVDTVPELLAVATE